MKHSLSLIFFGLFAVAYHAFADEPGGEKDTYTKAIAIHSKILTVDSHNDTPLYMMRKGFDFTERHDVKSSGSRVDLPRMTEGMLDGAFFAAFINQGQRTPEGNSKAFHKISSIIDTIISVVGRNSESIELALSPADARRIKHQKKHMAFIGIENGYAIGNDISLIEKFFIKGARYITICHSKNNDLCDSSTDSVSFHGLSNFGEKAILEMNRVGMMIDVSHVSDESFYDILKISQVPVIASHSCSRALCDHPRNLSDDMLKALATNDGVIQMCILSDYVKKTPSNPQRDSAFAKFWERNPNTDKLTDKERDQLWDEWRKLDQQFPKNLANVSDVVDHIDHIIKIAGIDHVGIGTDFDGGGGVAGCMHAGEMINITMELLKRGYREQDIEKIWSGNLLRVMNNALNFAQKQK